MYVCIHVWGVQTIKIAHKNMDIISNKYKKKSNLKKPSPQQVAKLLRKDITPEKYVSVQQIRSLLDGQG